VLNLANAIAATGGTDVELQRMVVNLQGVATLGKAMGKDINQFAFAGINIYKVLADATGQPIEKIQDMEISYDMLTMALRKAGEAGGMFENGLVNMANNTSIKISGLGDNVFKLSAQMFMDLKPAIDSIISGLSKFIAVLTSGWNWLVQNKDIVMALAIGVGVATVAYQAYLLSMGQGIIVTGLMTVAQWALNVAMNANPLGLIITGIAVLTAGIVLAYQKFGVFRAVLWGVWGTIKAWAALVVDVFENVWKVIKGVMTFDAAMITEGFKGTANAYIDAGKRLAQGFKDGYDSGMKDFAADQAKKTVAAPKTIQSGAQAGGKKGAESLLPTKSETKGAQGQKAITMTVNIGSLIKDFKISTTNIQEGTAKIREMVAQALINATNDSQLIAGQ
jgi:tape measure domain-containing protein